MNANAVTFGPLRLEGNTRWLRTRSGLRSEARGMKIETEYKPTVHQLAEAFALLGDEAQADFFEAVGRVFASWDKPGASDTQTYYIASHMKKCACVTEVGRDWVRQLAQYIGPKDYAAPSSVGRAPADGGARSPQGEAAP